MSEVKNNPVLITGAERSGSTFIARILDMCGVFSGACNSMFENTVIHSLHYEMLKNQDELFPITNKVIILHSWKDIVQEVMKEDGWYEDQKWMVKGSFLAQYWPVWNYAFPDAKWVIVRRRTGDVIQSCIKTGFMKFFKNPDNLHLLGLDEEKDGWLWWIRQYENKFVEMIQEGLNCRVVWPDRMADGNFHQVEEMVEWLGLEWNEDIPEIILPLFKSGGIKKWQE